MNWTLFASTFGLIFLAELPDKTAMATLLLAARHRAGPVFAGAAAALAIQSLVAVLLGSLLSRLPSRPVHVVAGIVFLIFAVVAWREKNEVEELVQAEDKKPALGFWKIAGSSFLVNFIAEWGDITQLATATLVAQTHAPLTIFFSSTLGLWAACGLTALIGHGAKKILNPAKIQKCAAVAFALVGIFLLVKR